MTVADLLACKVGLGQIEMGRAQQGKAQQGLDLLLRQAGQADLGGLLHLLPYLYPPAWCRAMSSGIRWAVHGAFHGAFQGAMHGASHRAFPGAIHGTFHAAVHKPFHKSLIEQFEYETVLGLQVSIEKPSKLTQASREVC